MTFKEVSLDTKAGVKFKWDMDSSAGWYGCYEGRQESREENANKPEKKVNCK